MVRDLHKHELQGNWIGLEVKGHSSTGVCV